MLDCWLILAGTIFAIGACLAGPHSTALPVAKVGARTADEQGIPASQRAVLEKGKNHLKVATEPSRDS